ncbi:MAG: hypothetical protein QXH10_09365 [Ignisphaera sp.]
MGRDVKAVFLVYKVFVEGEKPLVEKGNICFRDLCARICSQLTITMLREF